MGENVSNEILQMVSDEVRLKFGLNFPENRFKDLIRCLVNAGNLKGIDLKSYLKLFLSKLLSVEDWLELGSCLTIGETYFFRDKNLFDVLRNNVIPNIIHSKMREKKITIWSAGCSTGEEAYSIAIMLKELVADSNQWNINIIATDINLKSLRKAEEATYGEWSFRDTDTIFKKRYFDMVGAGKYKLKGEIKQMVTFSYLNLVDETYSVDNKVIRDVDIIFCRNVLMYLSVEEVKKIISRYYKTLNHTGKLIVAPSESLFLYGTAFKSININGTFLYGKEEEKRQDISPRYGTNHNIIKKTEIKETIIEARYSRNIVNETVHKTNEENSYSNIEINYEELCLRKADEGNLEEALEICKKAINENKVNPKYYYLLANIEQELGNVSNAIDALKKAIYLNSNFVMAYFDLGNLFLKLGRNREALKNFQNVNMLLDEFTEEQSIPSADVTAGMLKHFVENIIKGKDAYEQY